MWLLAQVRHFFKVGQARAQARAMVLSLAVQLAQQLPGFAATLTSVVKEHGDGSQLDGMKDVLNK